VKVGVDSFAARTLIPLKLCRSLGLELKASTKVGLIDVTNRPLQTRGVVQLTLSDRTSGRDVLISAVVVEKLYCDCDVLLGIDAQLSFGGHVSYDLVDGSAQFVGHVGEDTAVASASTIENEDFTLVRGSAGSWSVHPRFIQEPEHLPRKPIFYNKHFLDDDEIDSEIGTWLENGVISLVEPPSSSGKFAYVPVNVVKQEGKRASCRITFDCKDLNRFVSSKTTQDTNEICLDEIRHWRVMAGDKAHRWFLIDLKKAYLSIKLSREFAENFYFCYKSKTYRLERLPFGLNVAGKVLCVLLKHLFHDLSPEVMRVYRDDFFVRDDITEVVNGRLQENGFACRCDQISDSESLDVIVLGHRLNMKDGLIHWSRKQPLLETLGNDPNIWLKSLRDVAALAGRVAPAHLPVMGWMRPNIQQIRQLVGKEAVSGWNGPVSKELRDAVTDLFTLICERGDPCRGLWPVKRNGIVRLFTDASTKFLGCALEVDGVIVEDKCGVGEDQHINVRELSAVIYGLQLLLSWNISRDIELVVDNKATHAWIQMVIADEIIRVSGLYKSLIETRLRIIRNMMKENEIRIRAVLVKSCDNKSDELTRVSCVRKRVVGAIGNQAVDRIRPNNAVVNSHSNPFPIDAVGENQPNNAVGDNHPNNAVVNSHSNPFPIDAVGDNHPNNAVVNSHSNPFPIDAVGENQPNNAVVNAHSNPIPDIRSNPFPITKRAIDDNIDVYRVVQTLHEEQLHTGSQIMKKSLQLYFDGYYEVNRSEIDAAIDHNLRKCVVCLLKNRSRKPNPSHGGLSFDPNFGVGEMLEVDFVKMSDPGGFLTLIDVVSRFVEVEIIHTAPNAEIVEHALLNHFSRRGLPKMVRADLGKEFDNRRIAAFLEEMGIRYQHAPARYPQNMGVVERVHRSLLALARVPSHLKWTLRLLKAVYVYNHRPHSSIAFHTPIMVRRGEANPPLLQRREPLDPIVRLEVNQNVWVYNPDIKKKYEWPYVRCQVLRILGNNVIEVMNLATRRVSIVNCAHVVPEESDEDEGDGASVDEAWSFVENTDPEVDEGLTPAGESDVSIYLDPVSVVASPRGSNQVEPTINEQVVESVQPTPAEHSVEGNQRTSFEGDRGTTRSGRNVRKPSRLIEQL
jgi:hypothetical protein